MPSSLAPRVVVFAYHDVGYLCLEVLLKQQANIVALFTHADDPNEEIWFRRVADLAEQANIPVYKPENVNTADNIAFIKNLAPDLIFSFYYRHMISAEIFNLPKLGAYNMHGSLLPKYRGRCPINWVIIHGEKETGASLHVMEIKPDAGALVDQQACSIENTDTAKDVASKVALAAAEVLNRQLPKLLAGTADLKPQDLSQGSYFGGRKPKDGEIDWQQSAQQIYNLIRAVTMPYPGAFTYYQGKQLLIWWAEVIDLQEPAQTGEIINNSPLTIATGDGALVLKRWQFEGEAVKESDEDDIFMLGDRFNLSEMVN